MISSRIKAVILASVISAGNLVPTNAHATNILDQVGAHVVGMNHAGYFDRNGVATVINYIDSLYKMDPVNVAIALTGGMLHEGQFYIRHYVSQRPENRIEIYNLIVALRDNERDPPKKHFWNRLLTETFFPNGPPNGSSMISPGR